MNNGNKTNFRLLTKRELHECAYPCCDKRKYILIGIYLFVFLLGILISTKYICVEKFSLHLVGLILLSTVIIPMFIWLLINTLTLYMDYKFLRRIIDFMKNGREFEFRLWDKIENCGSRINWRIIRVPAVYFMLAKLLIDTENQAYVQTGERMRNLAIEADSRLSAISDSKEIVLLVEKFMAETTFLRPIYLVHSLNVKFPVIKTIVIAIVIITLLLHWTIGLGKALNQLLK